MKESKGNLRDGRIAILIFFISGLLLFDFSCARHWIFLHGNTGQNNSEQLCLDPLNKIVIKNFPADSSREHVSIPAKFTPFFFNLIPINSADKNMLMSVQGVGPSLAEKIIMYRQRIGPFKNELDLQNLKGVGLKRATKLATSFTFTEEP